MLRSLLVLTMVGCSSADPMVGLWRSSYFDNDGDRVETDADGVYIDLVLAEDQTGLVTLGYLEEPDWNETGDLEVQVVERGTWMLTNDGDGYDVDVICTAESDWMRCEGGVDGSTGGFEMEL